MDLPSLTAIPEALAGAPAAYVVPVGGPTLAGMPYPDDDVRWDVVTTAGIGLVVDLSGLPLSYDCSPIERTAIDLQDLVGGLTPVDEDGDGDRLRRAVHLITQARGAHTGVVVHCYGGRGRTGTVLGAYLVTLGYFPDDVTSWLNQLHHRRGRPGWPESPWQRQLLEEFH